MVARRMAWILAFGVAFYAVLIVIFGVTLLESGRPAAVLLAVGVLLLPLVGLWLVAGELLFGLRSQRLGRRLAAEGELPEGERPGDLAAADAVFEERKLAVEAAPGDWRAWYLLAMAYADAKDNARGRRALRKAIELERADRLRVAQELSR